MDQVLPALTTCHVYAHPAFVTGVCRHAKLPLPLIMLLIEGDTARALYRISASAQDGVTLRTGTFLNLCNESHV